MKNYKVTDLKFLRETFKTFSNNKINKNIQNTERTNYNYIVDKFSNKYFNSKSLKEI